MVTRVTRSESALDGGDCEDYLETDVEVPRGGIRSARWQSTYTKSGGVEER